MRLAVVLFLALLSAPVLAQTPPPGSCPEGGASAYLDVAGVRALLFNDGRLFWRGGVPVYEVPSGSDASAVFRTDLVVGGFVNGTVRAAVSRFAGSEFRPGPLAPDGTVLDPTCRTYDHIWRVSRADLAAYDAMGTATADVAGWPWAAGAPVVDGDGDPSNYDLAAGDRPAVSGDQTAFWVMNDRAIPHYLSESEPLGLEVRAEVFAQVADPGTAVGAALHYATLYRYRLTYRGEAPLDSAFVGLMFDVDLGDYSDDYIGSDPDLGLAYAYNADNDDEGAGSYGTNPPAVGIMFVEAPVTLAPQPYDGLLRGVKWYSSGDKPPTFPYEAHEYYRFMNCQWGDGTPQTYGYDGSNPAGTPTCFLYPGEPGTYWSEGCTNPACTQRNEPSDQRFMVSLGPFTMEPGQTETVTFAIVWARGSDNLDSVERLRTAARVVRAAYLGGRYDPQGPVPAPAPAPPPSRFALGAAPSPFTSSTTVRYEVPEGAGAFRVAVYDALGRRVAVLADGAQAPGVYEAALDGSALAPGVYVVRLETATRAAARVVVRAR